MTMPIAKAVPPTGRGLSLSACLLPNPLGLYDMVGNVFQWVEDCYNQNYDGAPNDGSAWISGICSFHVARGGSWLDDPKDLRSASRSWSNTGIQQNYISVRVGRLAP
jgi:formylglycine-generating enzyme required for sulfatase activity